MDIKEHVLEVPTAQEAHARAWIYVESNQAMLKMKFYQRVGEELKGAIEQGKFEVVLRVDCFELDFFPAVKGDLEEKGYGVEITYDKENINYIAVVTW